MAPRLLRALSSRTTPPPGSAALLCVVLGRRAQDLAGAPCELNSPPVSRHSRTVPIASTCHTVVADHHSESFDPPRRPTRVAANPNSRPNQATMGIPTPPQAGGVWSGRTNTAPTGKRFRPGGKPGKRLNNWAVPSYCSNTGQERVVHGTDCKAARLKPPSALQYITCTLVH